MIFFVSSGQMLLYTISEKKSVYAIICENVQNFIERKLTVIFINLQTGMSYLI